MIKTVRITGMSCKHCAMRVEKALNALEGVAATVNLEKGEAAVESAAEVDDAVLAEAVSRAGYALVP